MTAFIQGSLFEVPPPAATGLVYVMWCAAGNLWKIGYTTRTIAERARELQCIPVAAWPGTVANEKILHRQFGHLRISRATELFRRDQQIDTWVRSMARHHAVPGGRDALVDIFFADGHREAA